MLGGRDGLDLVGLGGWMPGLNMAGGADRGLPGAAAAAKRGAVLLEDERSDVWLFSDACE